MKLKILFGLILLIVISGSCVTQKVVRETIQPKKDIKFGLMQYIHLCQNWIKNKV